MEAEGNAADETPPQGLAAHAPAAEVDAVEGIAATEVLLDIEDAVAEDDLGEEAETGRLDEFQPPRVAAGGVTEAWRLTEEGRREEEVAADSDGSGWPSPVSDERRFAEAAVVGCKYLGMLRVVAEATGGGRLGGGAVSPLSVLLTAVTNSRSLSRGIGGFSIDPESDALRLGSLLLS